MKALLLKNIIQGNLKKFVPMIKVHYTQQPGAQIYCSIPPSGTTISGTIVYHLERKCKFPQFSHIFSGTKSHNFPPIAKMFLEGTSQLSHPSVQETSQIFKFCDIFLLLWIMCSDYWWLTNKRVIARNIFKLVIQHVEGP